MTPVTKAELLAAIAETDLEIKKTAARIIGIVSDKELHDAIDHIVDLRQVRAELEAKLAALTTNT